MFAIAVAVVVGGLLLASLFDALRVESTTTSDWRSIAWANDLFPHAVPEGFAARGKHGDRMISVFVGPANTSADITVDGFDPRIALRRADHDDDPTPDTGDPEADRLIVVEGDPMAHHALLHQDVRRTLTTLQGRWSIHDGVFAYRTQAPPRLAMQHVRDVIEHVRPLDDDLWAALLERVKTEHEPEVVMRTLERLRRLAPQDVYVRALRRVRSREGVIRFRVAQEHADEDMLRTIVEDGHETMSFRVDAAAQLLELDDPESAREQLRAWLQHPETVPPLVVFSTLERIDAAPFIAVIHEVLKQAWLDRDPTYAAVRHAEITAGLVRVIEPHVTPEDQAMLLAILCSAPYGAVGPVANALGRIGTIDAVEELVRVGDMSVSLTRQLCEQAVLEIQSRLDGAGAGRLTLSEPLTRGGLSTADDQERGRLSQAEIRRDGA